MRYDQDCFLLPPIRPVRVYVSLRYLTFDRIVCANNTSRIKYPALSIMNTAYDVMQGIP